MGRSRKRRSKNAHQCETQKLCRNAEVKVDIDINVQEDKYDESNPFVLERKKKSTRGKKKSTNDFSSQGSSQNLSRREKKRLRNKLARKKKKEKRAELLEKLSKVQAKPQELDYLVSTASMQTHGVKRFVKEHTVTGDTKIPNVKISNIKGSRKKEKNNVPPKKKRKLNPNTVSFEVSSNNSSDISDDDSEDDTADDTKDDTEDAKNKSSIASDVGNNCAQESIVDEAIVEVSNPGKSTEQNCALHDSESTSAKNDTTHSIRNMENNNRDQTCINQDQTRSLSEKVPAVFISLNRLPEVQVARKALPIFLEEHSIIEAVKENNIVLIYGPTGSGKTTQIPQFLYERGYTQNNKMIGITEPRRIAAMSMSARVGCEMNLPNVVAYHVRYENNVKEETQIKFMTDGVLLKEIKHDFYLTRYSVIIVDEAHERSVFSDVLIGLLSRIINLREKKGDLLKLIIMSATIRVEDFMENPKLFKNPPFMITLESQLHTVQVHFNINTPTDYVQAAYKKVCKIHTQLPAGAILVFLTGEKEVMALVKILRNTYPLKDSAMYRTENLENNLPDFDPLNNCKRKKKKKKSDSFYSLPAEINLDDYSDEPPDIEVIEHQLSDEDVSIEMLSTKHEEDFMPLYTLPLYSVLPYSEQQKVFQPPPADSRLCIVSTNVAETSITIPGLKYVVDSGKVKTKVYDKSGGAISQFRITWTSKASANQRTGRAGRTEGGHCYRLYSSSVFDNDFQDFSTPEIQRMPVDDVLLQMKALGIDRVVNFPFPSPPDNEALKAAERRLVLLGALQDLNVGERYKDIKKWEYSAKITLLGKAMSLFPLNPRYSKMLVLAYKHKVVPYMIAIVSAMTVPGVFMNTDGDASEKKGIRKITQSGKAKELGDAMVFLQAVALFAESKNQYCFCLKNNIRHKAMVEVQKMCLQLYREMNRIFRDLSLPLEMKLEPPNDEQIQLLQKILTTGLTDHVARLFPREEMKSNKDLKNAYKCLDLEEPVFIHPSSSLFSELPQFIIYQEIIHTSKYYMKGVVEINPEWLPAFAPTLSDFSDPLEEPLPSYDSEKDRILCWVNIRFGPWKWELPRGIIEMPKGLLKYKWFGFFLLNGQIYDFFKFYKKDLKFSPSTMIKSWATSTPHSRYILQALTSKEVDSKASLQKIWRENHLFLLREFWEWLPGRKHMEVECKWPPKL